MSPCSRGWTFGARVGVLAPLLVALGATACGSSSSTNVTGPTSSRCAATVSPAAASIGAEGGTGKVDIGVNRECTWTARAEAAWLTVTSAASGQGNGAVSFSADANGSTSPRRTGLVVDEVRVDVSQAGIACTYSLGSSGRSLDAAGGSISVSVSTQAPCAWTAASNAPWLSVTGGRSGIGAGTVSIAVAPNTDAAREGTVTVARQIFTVRQSEPGEPAPPPPPPPGPGPTTCTFTVAPLTSSVPAEGGTRPVTVTASDATCAWSATSGTSWLSILEGASGTGTGSVVFSAAPNSAGARSGSLSVAGQTVVVTQAGAVPPCTVTVSPTTVPKVGADGGSGELRVSASDAACPWTATSSAAWLRVTAGASGTGNGVVGYSVEPNPGAADRSATLTVAGRSVPVTQAGARAPVDCAVSVSPASARVPAAGGQGTADVTASDASCTWTATSSARWVTITAGTSGTGSGTVRYSVAPNPDAVARSATLDVSGQVVALTQEAASPAAEVSLEGTVSGLAGTCPSVTFTLQERLVATRSSTDYEKGDCLKLKNGRKASVTGLEQLSGTVLATLVRFD